MNRKTLPIFLLMLAIIVVMISVLGRRVTRRQVASVPQSAQSVAPGDAMVVAMAEEPATRAIDRSTRRMTRSTPKKAAAKSKSAERPYRRGRQPLPDRTEVAAATTGGDNDGGWVTVPETGVGLWPRP